MVLVSVWPAAAADRRARGPGKDSHLGPAALPSVCETATWLASAVATTKSVVSSCIILLRLGVDQAGIFRTEIVARRLSQTSPSEEQTSPFEEGEREHALPKTGL